MSHVAPVKHFTDSHLVHAAVGEKALQEKMNSNKIRCLLPNRQTFPTFFKGDSLGKHGRNTQLQRAA